MKKKAKAQKFSGQGELTLLDPHVTRTALVVPEAITFNDWKKYGESIALAGKAVMWWVGDWVAFGEDHFKDKAIQVADMTGYDPGTIANAVKVCRGIAPERRTALSFEHHKEVYTLEPALQEKWLSKAVQGHWNRAELRGALKDAELRKRGRVSKPKLKSAKKSKNGSRRATPATTTTEMYDALRKEMSAAMMVIPPLAELTASIDEKWSERMPSSLELGALEKLLDEGRAQFYDLLAVVRELLGVEEAAA